MLDEERQEVRRERGKRRVCLMGAARALLPEGAAGEELLGVSRDPEAMELLALLVLGREFLPPEGVKEGDRADGEVRRDWLAATLYPDGFSRADGKRAARERVRYLLDKLHPRPDRTAGGNRRSPPLTIRAHRGERERAVARVTWKEVWVDVLALREAARQIHSADRQREIIALGDRPLLGGMPYPWLQRPAFQKVRAELDSYVLSALARQADSQVVQMERANGAGRLAEADACRARALPLLDKAAERLGGYDDLRGRPEYAPLAAFEAQFSALRRRAAYPPPDAGEAPALPPKHNLPHPVTSFVGREQEKRDIRDLLASGRLVTVTGMGGCGKTRLAVQAAWELLGDWEQVRLVELAALTASDQVPRAVAAALGVTEQPGVTVMEALTGFLRDKRILILLDNCEHLLLDDRSGGADCGTFAAALLRSCPALSILATSRKPLNIDGEQLCLVSPLPFPPPDFLTAEAPDPVAALLGYDSARLFLDRAVRFRRFTLGPENVRPVAAICSALDGIPLALELAAARVKALPLERIAEMLSDRFGLLTSGRRESPARHKTLGSVIDWSYDMLDEPERLLFSRLSVFAGGWTLDAAQAVGCSGELPSGDVLGLLELLVDKSLVTADLRSSPGRYRMLETVRQYAGDRLRAQGELAETGRRHRRFYLGLAEEADPLLKGPDQKVWLDRLEAEHDNLRAALACYRESGEQREQWLQLAGHLWWFWWVRGHLREGVSHLAAALAGGGEAPARLRARAHEGAGNLCQHLGDYEAARTQLEKGLHLSRVAGHDRGAASLLGSLGNLAYNTGDLGQAQARHQEGLDTFRGLNDERGILVSLINLGNVAYESGDYGRAASLFQQGLDLARRLQDERHVAVSLYSLANAARETADFAGAGRMFRESLTMFLAWGDQWGAVHVLESVASLAGAQRRGVRAARLWGASEALRERLKSPLTPSERVRYDKTVAEARETLGEGAFEAARARGRAMSWEQAVAFALGETAP